MLEVGITMPISFRCPCGKVLKAQQELAGKRTQCPACKTVLVIPTADRPVITDPAAAAPVIEPWVLNPDAGFDHDVARSILATSSADGEAPDDEFDAAPPVFPSREAVVLAVAHSTSNTAIPVIPRSAETTALTAAAEPWYYSFLDGYAMVLVALGAAQFVFFGFGFVANAVKSAERPHELASLIGPGISFAVLLVSLAVGALLRLAVDAARSLRVLRIRAARS
jgi:hypothetical protein